MKFIEQIENHAEEIEEGIETAERAVENAIARLEAFKQRKVEFNLALKEIARGGEPDVDSIFIADAEGKPTLDLLVAFTEAMESEGADEVQNAVEAHLEAKAEEDEERIIDAGERSRADYVEEDSDWE